MSGYYRNIDVRTWGDRDFRSLSAPAKLLWIYTLSGPHTTPGPGLWRFEVVTAARDLALGLEIAVEAFDEIVGLGFAEWDADTGLLWLPKRLRYARVDAPDNVRPWVREISSLPECELRDRAIAAIRDELSRWKSKGGTVDPRYRAAFEEEAARDGSFPDGPPDGGGRGGPPGGGPTGGHPAPPSKEKAEAERKQKQTGPPDGEPDEDGFAVAPDQTERGENPDALLARALLDDLLRERPRESASLSRLVAEWIGERRPWKVVADALNSTLRAVRGPKEIRSATAYLRKVIRVETPIHHGKASQERAKEAAEDNRRAAEVLFGE